MLILLLVQSSIFINITLIESTNYISQSSQYEIKMKSSKSQKSISIITDRKAQYDLLSHHHNNPHIKGSQTCTNQPRNNYIGQSHMAISCKNLTEQAEPNEHRSRSASGQKHRRQRSSSTQSRGDLGQGQQQRKKQLDYLCFQKIVNIIKKYLIERQQSWNFDILCYQQLIKLLWLCRFVPYSNQQQFIHNNQQNELKKVYLLWLTIAVKKYVNFRDFLVFVQIVENISVEKEKLQAVIFSLQSQIKSLCFEADNNYSLDPNFTFFIKRIQIKRQQNQLCISQQLKQKLVLQFKSFKLNKLKNCGLFECVKIEQNQFLVSKKSAELAEQKRKKIETKIRQKKPHVQNINLLDILSFRERDHYQNVNVQKIVVPAKKKSCTLKRGEIKKEIQLLSRPKVHFEERKQDEVNFYREEEEFTFHPRIHSYKENGGEKVLQIKNADKVLVRMKQARKLKEQKETILQKGWSNIGKPEQLKPFSKLKQPGYHNLPDKQNINMEKEKNKIAENERQNQMKAEKKVEKYQVSKDYLRIPILYIDVNIEEGKKQRIIIYDNDKAADLAREFGQKHKLSQDTVGRLQLLLQQQMDTVLARIEQETDDECSIIY